MPDTDPTHELLRLDPDLGHSLAPEHWQAARRDLRVRVVPIESGSWDPDRIGAMRTGAIGLLVLDGVLMRELNVHDAPSAELLGPGDLIRGGQSSGPQHELLPAAVRWSAFGRASVAVLDRRIALEL